MKHYSFWLVLILIAAGLQFLGRINSPAIQAEKIEPASVSKIDATDRARLTLRPEAARRLDIKTVLVREETIVARRKLVGEVRSNISNLDTAIVQVNLTEKEVKRVSRDEPAFILPFDRDSKVPGIKALPIKEPAKLGLYGLSGTIYFEVTSANHGLVNQQFVFVELTLSGSEKAQKIIPYATVLYDANGNTWVYTNPESLVFMRQPVEIDAIEGDEALLADGPPVGTAVVTVGGAELFGAEFGVGK